MRVRLRRGRSRHPAREPVGGRLSSPEDDLFLEESSTSAGSGEARRARKHGAGEGRSSPGWFWSAAVAVGMVVLVVGVAGVKGWADLKSSRARADELRQELLEVEESVRSLEIRIRELGPEGRLLEKVAREEVGLIGPDEVLVLLPEDDGS